MIEKFYRGEQKYNFKPLKIAWTVKSSNEHQQRICQLESKLRLVSIFFLNLIMAKIFHLCSLFIPTNKLTWPPPVTRWSPLSSRTKPYSFPSKPSAPVRRWEDAAVHWFKLVPVHNQAAFRSTNYKQHRRRGKKNVVPMNSGRGQHFSSI